MYCADHETSLTLSSSSLTSLPFLLRLPRFSAVTGLACDSLIEIECFAVKKSSSSSSSEHPLVKISTSDAPAAIGPYSQAVVNKRAGIVYVSGCIALPSANEFKASGLEKPALIGTTAAEQCTQSLANMAAVLKAAGSSLDKVVKTTVLLANFDDFATVNAAYAASFGGHKPARSCYAVKGLPMGALVEIEAVAVLAGSSSTGSSDADADDDGVATTIITASSAAPVLAPYSHAIVAGPTATASISSSSSSTTTTSSSSDSSENKASATLLGGVAFASGVVAQGASGALEGKDAAEQVRIGTCQCSMRNVPTT